jgi:hypothetical protein
MPFRNETQFSIERVQAMTAAFDSVVAWLKLKPDDPRTGKLATLIVQLAKGGRRRYGQASRSGAGRA